MRKKGVLRFIALFIAVIIGLFNIKVLDAKALENMNFKNINVEHGLTQGTIYSMLQDTKGYVWIGTADGLHRYNGFEYKQYRHNKKNENSIVNNTITALKEDMNGDLWVGTASGLSKINLTSNEIKNYHEGEENGNLSHYNICEILITKEGKVIVATADGLNLYNEKEDRFTRIFESGLLSQVIYSIDEDENGDLWVGTEKGLNKIDYENGEPTIQVIDKGSFIYKVFCDDLGRVWAGTKSDGLIKTDIRSNKVEKYKENPDEDKGIPSNNVKVIEKDKNGGIWIGTGKGLLKYNEKSNDFTRYKHTEYDSHSLINNDVYSIMEDKSGIIWVGTYSGISMFNPLNLVRNYKHDPYDDNSLGEAAAVGIYEEDGQLWVGSREKGISIIDRETGNVHKLTEGKTPYGLSSNRINTMVGNDKYVWVGTLEGINRIDKKTKKVKVYGKENGLTNTEVRSLIVSDEEVIIGTVDGLFLMDMETEKIEEITYVLNDLGVKDHYISTMHKDKEGTVWIGTMFDGGLIEYNKAFNKMIVHKSSLDGKNKIASNSISCISEDDKGQIWIGTDYGVSRFNKESREFKNYDETNGLINNQIYGILFDTEDNPWMSTNQGVARLDIKTETFSSVSIVDGLQHNEFNTHSSFKNYKGEFIFGGINGVSVFDPQQVQKNECRSNVVIENVNIRGEEYENIDGQSFDNNDNSLKIKFFIPDYRSPDRIKYFIKLEGFDEEWQVSEGNEVNYTNLSPGKYNFKIKAMNHNGVMTEETNFSFNIRPPFWKTGDFLVIILIILVVVYLHNKERVKTLDRKVEEKTKSLNDEMGRSKELLSKVIVLEKNKNNYFVNLSHELRTPLNVLLSSEQLIDKLVKREEGISKEKLEYYIDIMRRNTVRLLNLINNIIDTTKIESGTYTINYKSVDIIYLVEETTLTLKDYIESKGIELIIDPQVEEKIIECDSEEIERCIINLVSNASKFTPQGGNIHITIEDLNNYVKISVKDSGIGIDKKYHEKIFDRFNQVCDFNYEAKGGSGLGLTITKHIIEMHKGKIFVESEINKGSNFIILLPIKHIIKD